MLCTLLISRSQIDSKSGVNKKGTERLLFWSKFYSFFNSMFSSNFYSLSRVVLTLQGVKTTPLKELKLLQNME